MKILSVIVAYLFVTCSAFADINFRLLADFKFSHSSFGSKDGDVDVRKLNGPGAEAIAGINIGRFLIGAGGEYFHFVQMTDPEDVDDTNLSGNMLNFSTVGGIALGKLLLLGKYYFKSDYRLKNKSTDGEKVSYTAPNRPFGVSLLYRPGARSFWSLDFTQISFEKQERDGSSTKFDSADVMEFSAIGLSYGFML